MSVRNWLEPIIEPWSFFSLKRSIPRISTFVLDGTIPITVAVPPISSISKACSAVSLSPIASKLYSTPPFVSSRTASTTLSTSPAFTVSVAPIRRAASRLSGFMSTAIIRPAPATRDPWIAESPIPPQPITQTVAPTGIAAVRTAAPKPVVTPQPIKHAFSNGMSGVTFTTPFW